MPNGQRAGWHIIGIGQSVRQDDGVGPYVARSLVKRGLSAAAHEGDGTALMELWGCHRRCIVIDAVCGSGPPGRIRLFTDTSSPAFLRTPFVHSTHRFGLPEAIQLGRNLGRLPNRLVVIGISGTSFEFGEGLSPPVAEAADRLVSRLCGETKLRLV